MQKRSGWTEEEKTIVKIGIIAVVGAWVIILADFYLLENFFRRMLNLYPGAMSLLVGTRLLLFILYFIGFLPAALYMEFAVSWVKKRSFKPRNTLIFSSVLR